MAARKKVAGRKAAPAKAASRFDPTRASLKQIAGIIVTVGILATALNQGFSWYYSANESHRMNGVQEPRILSLEKDNADYKTYWDDEIQRRKKSIAQAELYCHNNIAACRGE